MLIISSFACSLQAASGRAHLTLRLVVALVLANVARGVVLPLPDVGAVGALHALARRAHAPHHVGPLYRRLGLGQRFLVL